MRRRKRTRMIDIHTHILPKVDDGAHIVEEAYQMIEKAQKQGFTDIIATSHYMENQYEVDEGKRQKIIETLQHEIMKRGIEIKIHNGNEIYITPNFVTLIKEKKASTLANSRYVLFELPMSSKVTYLEEMIFEIKANGMIPILAHPERYSYVQKDPNFIGSLIKQGVLMQSNFASITDYYGKSAKNTLKTLLKANMIHFLAVDAHNHKKYDIIQEQIQKFEKIISKEQLENLTTVNPKHILDNTVLQIEEPKPIKRGLFH